MDNTLYHNLINQLQATPNAAERAQILFEYLGADGFVDNLFDFIVALPHQVVQTLQDKIFLTRRASFAIIG